MRSDRKCKDMAVLMARESAYLLLIASLAVIVGKLIFSDESIGVTVRVVFSYFWLFLVPGFALMYYWLERLDFLERLVIGAAVGTAAIGIGSYYLSMAGLHVKYHPFILPLVMILAAVLINVWCRPRSK
jgi:uncharacterized membrane protein